MCVFSGVCVCSPECDYFLWSVRVLSGACVFSLERAYVLRSVRIFSGACVFSLERACLFSGACVSLQHTRQNVPGGVLALR